MYRACGLPAMGRLVESTRGANTMSCESSGARLRKNTGNATSEGTISLAPVPGFPSHVRRLGLALPADHGWMLFLSSFFSCLFVTFLPPSVPSICSRDILCVGGQSKRGMNPYLRSIGPDVPDRAGMALRLPGRLSVVAEQHPMAHL